MRNDGHVGLSNDKVKEVGSGDFKLALSYLKESARTSYFVIHVYSNTFDYSPYLQRSNVRSSDRRRNFLERLGFTYYDQCNIMDGRCYYRVVEEVPKEVYDESFLKRIQRTEAIHRRFDQFASRINEIFQRMNEVDRMLFEAGIELPWDDLRLSPIVHSKEEEKVYPKGHVYDFYADLLETIKTARNEVLIMDAYPDEAVLNLYIKKIPTEVRIRILTNKPQGDFLTVAKMFKSQPKVDFEVRQSKDCHDRIFFVDKGCWVMGQSIKDAGKKPTYLARMEGYDSFRKVFDDLWNSGTLLI